MKIGNRR